MARSKVRVGIVGVGNCASSFVQGLGHYAEATSNERSLDACCARLWTDAERAATPTAKINTRMRAT